MPPSKNISFDELAQYFHLPINQVAKELGVCATILKKTCRRNGIPRWPHRKIKSLENRIANLQVNLDKNPQDREEIAKEIELLKAKKAEIMKHPDVLVRNQRNGEGVKKKFLPPPSTNVGNVVQQQQHGKSPYTIKTFKVKDMNGEDDDDEDEDDNSESVSEVSDSTINHPAPNPPASMMPTYGITTPAAYYSPHYLAQMTPEIMMHNYALMASYQAAQAQAVQAHSQSRPTLESITQQSQPQSTSSGPNMVAAPSSFFTNTPQYISAPSSMFTGEASYMQSPSSLFVPSGYYGWGAPKGYAPSMVYNSYSYPIQQQVRPSPQQTQLSSSLETKQSTTTSQLYRPLTDFVPELTPRLKTENVHTSEVEDQLLTAHQLHHQENKPSIPSHHSESIYSSAQSSSSSSSKFLNSL